MSGIGDVAESLREAVEGFERERAACAHPGLMFDRVIRVDFVGFGDLPWRITREGVCARCGIQAHQTTRAYTRVGLWNCDDAAPEPPRFTRADVLDLVTGANDARQLAIAAPDLAEEALARAARYDDLAARLAQIVPAEGA